MTRVLRWEVPVDDEWHPIGGGPVALVDVRVHDAAARMTSGSPVAGVVNVWTVETEKDVTVLPARVWGTGQDVEDNVEHLGSCQDGPLVWHVFRGRSATDKL